MKFHARSFAFFPVNLWAKEKLLAVYSNENVLQYVVNCEYFIVNTLFTLGL